VKIHQLLEHHDIARNPFSEEDAQTDPVFKDLCIHETYHPAWDKVFGDPTEPASAIVFGEKGAGKTALRLQIAKHVEMHNETIPEKKVFIVEYDDFNPFLDRFRERFSGRRRRADRLLREWKLWDHMDAILVLGVSQLVDRIMKGIENTTRFDRHRCRDMLLLAACYDQSTAETKIGRWEGLRKHFRFRNFFAKWDIGLGLVGSVLLGLSMILLAVYQDRSFFTPFYCCLYLVVLLVVWVPCFLRTIRCFLLARRIHQHLRVGAGKISDLRQILRRFYTHDWQGQPFPSKDRTDDRYELLAKFQGILQSLGYTGIFVLVDRIDEPHLINGSAELMRLLLWPMLDNKFLKQPGVGLKLMLPVELTEFVEREDRDFYQRARLDKQNMIPTLEWTGVSLYDMANARIRACAREGSTPNLRTLLDDSVTDQRLLEALGSLRVPRNLFKFLYRLLVAHCNAHTDQQPTWQISRDTFESILAVFSREQDAFDRGLGAG